MSALLTLSRLLPRRFPDTRSHQQLEAVLAEAPALRALADDQIQKASLALRYRVRAGEPVARLLPQAFALVREAGRRTLGLEHFPVQLLAGIALWERSIAVMQTGEGKTLTATLPLYLASLAGKGAHLATSNDYLAARDGQWMQPLFSLLGTSTGIITSRSEMAERRAAYQCEVTYSTARELGFDFLRERLRIRASEAEVPLSGESRESRAKVQPELHFCLVDEADNILIDEARTPLVLSLGAGSGASAVGLVNRRAELYQWAAQASSQLRPSEHYVVEFQPPRVRLNRAGRELARELDRQFGRQGQLSGFTAIELQEQLELALLVTRFYQPDRHYIVRDGKVVIVDEYSGRLAEGRQWREGLHQAIEAREGIAISPEVGEAARVTIQELFSRYQQLAGMTGTLANSAGELWQLYRLKAADIPTNRPPRRVAWPTLVCVSATAKWAAIAREVAEVHATGRPVLVGTRSIDKSELLSALLTEQRIEHALLNAKDTAQEAEVVAAAGGQGRVTVATNLAGRGTDIQLDEAAFKAGGLHVILSELHESARIDRQLVGRCGRQGDPGSFRYILSLEDELLQLGLNAHERRKLQRQAAVSPERLGRLEGYFHRAQRRLEQQHARDRRMLLEQQRRRQELYAELGLDEFLD